MIPRALSAAPDAMTPGDAKIAFTTELHTASIGRGRRVPIELVPPLLLAETNELLAMLGYSRMTPAWNAERAGQVDTTLEVPGDAERLLMLMPDRIDARLLARQAGTYAIVVEDVGAMAWHVDCASGGVKVGAVDGVGADTTIYGSASVLVAVLQREENPATMFETGGFGWTATRATGD